MEIDLENVKLDRSDLNSLHDVIFEALDYIDELSDEIIMEYWKEIPRDIKMDAIKWGLSDTPTRDNIYVWLQENKK